MKRKVLGLILAISLSTPVFPSGFPVVDVANLLQNVMKYTQVLKEYEQILKQTGLDVNQLLTLIEQYEQTLREYQVLLNQVEGLKRKIERRDYPGIEREIRKYAEQYSGDVETPSNREVERRYGSIGTRQEVDKLAEDAIGYVPSDLSRSYTLANDSNVQANQREYFKERNQKTRQDMNNLDSERLALGDQSELATLQLLVEQNQILMEQIDLQNEMRLNQFGSVNQSDQRLSKAIYDAKVRRLQRIKEANENGIQVDESPLL
ncbi:hypothetical protein [Vibrio europaeus]|uniref:hypothetical protein n=1 Tax=Vibrio europaeus TaxID=300876 RepID=UPI00233E6638|nr:hypothetical protein [Vibrio europaeus]MDC5711166.1 hypothetical protein [Vibrio europaeus]MDC5713195.1 hypothetical protein [Vibrio europaeus]